MSHVVVLCARLFRVLSYSEPHPSKLPAFPSRKHDRKSGTPQNRLHRCKNNGVCNARSSVSDLRVDPPTPPTAPSGCAARLDPPTAQSRQALATGLGNAACGFVALRDDPTFVWDHTPSRARACSRARGPSRGLGSSSGGASVAVSSQTHTKWTAACPLRLKSTTLLSGLAANEKQESLPVAAPEPHSTTAST